MLNTDVFIYLYVPIWGSGTEAGGELADLHKGPKAHWGKQQIWFWDWGTGIRALQKARSSL